ncbi:MAG: SurA N-terminal domain-containing protein [Coriobacteriia bacterium]|nr:SurA N-terminal domain-containing protein [Coriobacteriia bacterium]
MALAGRNSLKGVACACVLVLLCALLAGCAGAPQQNTANTNTNQPAASASNAASNAAANAASNAAQPSAAVAAAPASIEDASAFVAVPENACANPAAVVDGYAITQESVDELVNQHRQALGLETQEDFAAYLQDVGTTEQEYRSQIADVLAGRTRLQLMAQQSGITISPEQLAEGVEARKVAYLGEGYSQSDWEQVLAAAGETEETFAFNVYTLMLSEKLSQ